MKMVTFTIIFMMILNTGKSSINQPRRRRPWQKEDLLQAPMRQKMVLRKMNSPVLHRCRMDRNIFTRHLPPDPIPYLSKSEKRQNLAGKSCLRTRPGLIILLPVKGKNLLRSPLGFHQMKQKKWYRKKQIKWGLQICSFQTGVMHCAIILKRIIV